ncbi:hypothetical protein HZ326_6995 [Fusarium oxysporum f. sp. albedinis]|nr:hypothetical protein HZ326_6995 [Fusarium oxysporum f. sp. albedinis]
MPEIGCMGIIEQGDEYAELEPHIGFATIIRNLTRGQERLTDKKDTRSLLEANNVPAKGGSATPDPPDSQSRPISWGWGLGRLTKGALWVYIGG